MGKDFPISDNKKCRECGKESSVMVNGLCLDCYDVVEEDLKKDSLEVGDDEYDELEELQEKYDKEFEEENSKEEMIMHGRIMKDPEYDKISKERTISRISHRNKPNIVFKMKKR